MAVDRKTIMENTLKQIREKLPKENIGKYKDMAKFMDVETMSSGSLGVDIIMNGGFPKGRISEIVGKASSGKSTMSLSMIAALQKEKPDANILYIDAENALDPSYARQLGVNLDEVVLIQPENGEAGYQAAHLFLDSGIADLVIIDSIPAMIPAGFFDYEVGEQTKIGMGASLDNQGVSRMLKIVGKTKAVVILINQYREKVTIGMPKQGDGVSGNGYLPGGQGLPFMMSSILKIQRVGKEFIGDEVVGDEVLAMTIKHKTGKPLQNTNYTLDYGQGISLAAEIMNWGVEAGLVGKTARTYWLINDEATPEQIEENPDLEVVEGSRQGSGIKFKAWLEERPELMRKLRAKILKYYLDQNRNFHDEEVFEESKAEIEQANSK